MTDTQTRRLWECPLYNIHIDKSKTETAVAFRYKLSHRCLCVTTSFYTVLRLDIRSSSVAWLTVHLQCIHPLLAEEIHVPWGFCSSSLSTLHHRWMGRKGSKYGKIHVPLLVTWNLSTASPCSQSHNHWKQNHQNQISRQHLYSLGTNTSFFTRVLYAAAFKPSHFLTFTKLL